MELLVRDTLPMQVAWTAFAGPAPELGRALALVQGWVERQGLPAAGPLTCLFFEEPGRDPVDWLRAEVRLPCRGRAVAAGGVALKRVPVERLACAIHRGSAFAVGQTVDELFDWLRQQGERPTGRHYRLAYLQVPPRGRDNQWEIEVQVRLR